MQHTLAEIRTMTREQLIEEHDGLSVQLNADLLQRGLLVDELNRRAANRSTLATTGIAVLALVVAIVGLFAH